MFMLLDIEEVDSFDDEEPDYSELDELVQLHSRAMLHMNKLGWPIGSLHRISVGEKWVPGRGWRRGGYETSYEYHFGASSFGGILIMRSGAVYGHVRTLCHDGIRDTKRQLDFATIDAGTRMRLKEAFEYILDIQPAPVYIDS